VSGDIFLFGYSIDRMSGQPPPSPSPSLPRRSGRNKSPAPATGAAAAASGGNDDDLLKYTQSTNAKADPPPPTDPEMTTKKSRKSASPPPPPPPPPLPQHIQEIIQARRIISVNGISLWYEENPEPIDLFNYLTSVNISDMTQIDAYRIRDDAYELVYPKAKAKDMQSYRVWFNLDYLISAMRAFMMPSIFTPSLDKTFIVNFGGAGTGKSNVLYALGEYVNCTNTFILDPDRFYEFFATFLGYMPINDTKEENHEYEVRWNRLRADFSKYENVILPSAIVEGNRRPIEYKEDCKVKAVCMTDYRKMLTAVMYEVFKMALNIDGFRIIDEPSNPASSDERFIQKVKELQPDVDVSRLPGLNIVFDSTGSMLDVIQRYIQLAEKLGYKIVFVGVYSTLSNCEDRVLPPKTPTEATAAAARAAAGTEATAEATAKAELEAELEAKANSWNPEPEKLISRPDVESSTQGASAATDMLVKCRNTKQHRKTDFGGLRGTWEGMKREKVNGLITYALGKKYRLILIENNSNPVKHTGGAGIIYDSGDGFIEKPERNCCLYRSDGFYGVDVGQLKKIEDAAKAASASAATAGQGGYSRKRRLHTNRPRKTMKKYTRRVTRRRGHGHGRGHGRRSQRR
jgi:hypothetical protein